MGKHNMCMYTSRCVGEMCSGGGWHRRHYEIKETSWDAAVAQGGGRDI
eukprot:SAG11_NODE_362_length_10182_cov_9.886641_7_plen_48_part_00